LIESAVNGMLSALDPHSSYLNTKDYQDMQVQTRGEFFGLGIEVTMENELIKVISPIDDTPAAKAGVLAGDIITQLDGEQVQGLTLREAVEKMRGPANSSIVLTIVREGADEPLKVTVVRDVIRVSRCAAGLRMMWVICVSPPSASRRPRAWRKRSRSWRRKSRRIS
jgi:carboxyl-terminal processing protease